MKISWKISLLSMLSIFIICFLFNNCSINKMVVNRVADQLTSGEGSTVFTGDDDPELIRDALPFALKLYESLLESVPENTELLLATGKAYCMYAYAFIQMDAEKLPDEEINKKNIMLKRAKKMYLRGKKYIIRAIEIKYDGFTNSIKNNTLESFLSETEKDDVPYLFWAGMAWMGAFSVAPFDMELSISKSKAVLIISRAFKLDESFEQGAIHNFYISYYGSMPVDMGGSEKKAQKHFKRSLELSKGLLATPYINLAISISIKNQNAEEFKNLLQKALEINIDKEPNNRLVNILSQRKAMWLLDHIDNFFLIKKGEIKK